MGIIKTAAEIAKEKLANIGEPTEAERLKWKYGPEGEKLAATFLKEDINLAAEVKKYEDKPRQFIVNSLNEILVRNITLPRNDIMRRTNKKAMDGIKALKTDKNAAENVIGRIRQLLDHYGQEGESQKKQAYEQLKTEFEQKMQQAIRKQTGTNARVKFDVEKQPQFQEEWQRLISQMEAQYSGLLDDYKKELEAIK
jgi:hypothetical protein